MQKKNRPELLLTGNTVLDKISVIGEEGFIVRCGGIANVARASQEFGTDFRLVTQVGGQEILGFRTKMALLKEFPDAQAFSFELDNAKAEISLKRDGSFKSASVKWAKESLLPMHGQYKWGHIAYLNKLKLSKGNVFFVRESCEILSGDICAGEEKEWREFAHNFDYIFASREELDDPVKPRRALIIHDRNGCELITESKKIEFSIKSPQDDVLILGAGDYFAAAFIQGKLTNLTDEDACEFAIHETPRLLHLNGKTNTSSSDGRARPALC